MEATDVGRSVRSEAIGYTRDAWVIGGVCVVPDTIWTDSAVWIWVGSVRHGVGIVIVACIEASDGAWTDTAWWLAEGMLGEGSWVHSRHPDASLVDAVELGDEVLEVDVVVGIVVEGQLAPVPDVRSVK